MKNLSDKIKWADEDEPIGCIDVCRVAIYWHVHGLHEAAEDAFSMILLKCEDDIKSKSVDVMEVLAELYRFQEDCSSIPASCTQLISVLESEPGACSDRRFMSSDVQVGDGEI